MRVVKIFCFLVLSMLPLTACGNDQQQTAATTKPVSQTANTAPSQQEGGFQSITPQAAKDLIASTENLLLIDVRGPDELKNGAIAGSVLLPFWNILQGNHNLPKDRPILLICAVGGRSFAVGQVLKRQGYGELYNLSGGIDAWRKAGLPLEFPK